MSPRQADETGLTSQVAEECVAYPDAATWGQWVGRWPALPSSLLVPLREKWGANLGMISEPAFDDQAPDEVQKALAAGDCTWRRVKPPGASLDVVIGQPSLGLWRMFQDAIRKPGVDLAAKVRELATACTRVILADGKKLEVAPVIERWPGVAVLIIAVVGQLAGVTAEASLGEW